MLYKDISIVREFLFIVIIYLFLFFRKKPTN